LGSQQGRQRSITRVNPSAQLASASSSIRRESNIDKASGLVKANSHKPLQGRGSKTYGPHCTLQILISGGSDSAWGRHYCSLMGPRNKFTDVN